MAKDLYTSTLFKLSFQYAEKLAPDMIYVLSAKYGLLDIDEEIGPYELTLNRMHDYEIRAWADHVIEQLKATVSIDKTEFIFLAGYKYRKYLLPHITDYKIPLEGLSIGRQLQRLKELIHGEGADEQVLYGRGVGRSGTS